MGRWEPNARGRLGEAALELYLERGFEQTTVAEIAERAGVTARTFFRHYADKREVLFANSSTLVDVLVAAAEQAPPSASPMAAIATALEAAGGLLGERREFSRRRQQVIAANRDLQERELIKMATLSAALAGCLERRGVDPADAGLAAETGIAVFRLSFERWVTEDDGRDLVEIVHESLQRLTSLTKEG